MRRKMWSAGVTIEQAVIGAMMNVRAGGRRRQAMERFAKNYAPTEIRNADADLELQCKRTVRALGAKSARRLATWFSSVRRSEDHPAIPTGVPRAATFEIEKEAA